MDWHRDEFVISTDVDRLQVDVIQKFLAEESYWARSRTPEQTKRAILNSICFGLYDGDAQIGFARVVTDKATFADLGDVFVLDSYRGRGLGKWLMETVISHEDVQGLRRWVVDTSDAQELYRKFVFDALTVPDRWMEKAAPDAY